MNKISKKIVSLVTMAAFALTLVPAAAFAAPSAPLRSSISVDSNSESLTLDNGQPVTANIELTIGTGDAKQAPVYVWLTKDDSNDIYRYAKNWTATTTDKKDAKATNGSQGELANALKINGTYVASGGTISISTEIEEAGTYTVHAGIAAAPNDYASRSDLATIDTSSNAGTITVEAAETYVDSITVQNATATQGQGGGIINYNGVPNGIRSTQVVADIVSKYVDGNGTPSSEGKVVKIDNPYGDVLTISDADGKVTNDITVDENNQAVFYVKAASTISNGTYTLTLSADNETYLLSINVGSVDTQAVAISKVDTGKTAIAKDDVDTDWDSFDSVAQFVVKNADGDILAPTTPGLSGFDAFTANNSGAQNDNNVDVIDAPEKGKNAVFKVVASDDNTDAFTLKIVDASKLAVGEYTVRVTLNNGKGVDLSFTVANFGKVVDTVIEFTDNATNKTVTEVVDGHTYTAKALQVDENGLTKPLNASVGYTGDAAENVTTGVGTVTFTVNDDVDGHDNALVGSKIGVWAFTTAYGQYAYGEVTVVDEDNVYDYTLEFDPTNGPAGEDNTVEVTVVNADGKKVNVNGDLKVYLLDKSNEDANVYINPAVNVKNGVGKITINSDKETDLDVVVGVISTDTDTKDVVFANTLEYTVGAEDPNADTTVVMTIGSTDYVVNNKMITGDAAPYVDSAWRTMVPFRVLGETFGAEVNWDEDTQTVSYTYGDTEIVMTIGEDTYTVNGEEKTMNTAPVIQDSRTMVPVRFIAEALGYTVTPLQDGETGLTASVVFQK